MNFEEVYNSQRHRLFGFCLGRLGNPADAEEVVQDAFFQLSRVWDRYELRNVGALLLQQAKWLIADKRLKESRQKRTAVFVDLESIPIRHKFPEPLPERLLDMIWHLPRLQRRSLVMFYWADMTPTEIARAMGTHPNAADYRIKAGIKALRKRLNV